VEQVTSASSYTADETRQLQNCIALLTRLVPAGFEQFDLPDQLDTFEQQVFWSAPAEDTKSPAPQTPRDEIANNGNDASDTPTDLQDGSGTPKNSASESRAEEITKNVQSSSLDALAPRILSLVVKLLFLPHFTVAPNHSPIWYSGLGVGSDAKIGSTTAAMAINRVQVLRLLLAVLSQDLFLSPALYFKRGLRNQWLDYFTTPPRDSTIYGNVAPLLYSLLNSTARYDPIGWGVPYNHLVFSDHAEELLYKCLQVLGLVLNYSAASWTDQDMPFTEQQVDASDAATENLFIATLREITDRASLDQLYGMLTALFGNPLRANNTYLPNSAKELNCHPELLILFWALIRNHPVSSIWCWDTEN